MDSPGEGQTPTGNTRALDRRYPSVLEPGLDRSDVQQESPPTLAAGQDIRPRGQSGLEILEAGAVVGGQAVGTIGPGEPDEAVGSSTTTSETRTCQRLFRMAIHRDNDQSTQRLACFDTDATLDMVSLDVVKELGLKKEPYPGGQLRLLGESFLPEWRVCFDWHVSGRNKTYTSTFLVMNEQLSRGFDVSVSWRTIELIKFYHVKDKTFFTIDGSRKENKDLEDGPPKVGMEN